MLETTHLMKKVLQLCNSNLKLFGNLLFFITFISLSLSSFSKYHRFTVNVYYYFFSCAIVWKLGKEKVGAEIESKAVFLFRLMKHHLWNKRTTTFHYIASSQPASQQATSIQHPEGKQKGYKRQTETKQRYLME